MPMHRAILSAFWLATVLLVAGWMLAPATAAAHPGHPAGADTRHMAAVSAPPLFAPVNAQALSMPAQVDSESPQGHQRLVATVQPRGGETCAGAAYCGTSNGCCAAYLSAATAPPTPSGSSRVLAIPTGDRQGFGTAALPEPPRPNR